MYILVKFANGGEVKISVPDYSYYKGDYSKVREFLLSHNVQGEEEAFFCTSGNKERWPSYRDAVGRCIVWMES